MESHCCPPWLRSFPLLLLKRHLPAGSGRLCLQSLPVLWDQGTVSDYTPDAPKRGANHPPVPFPPVSYLSISYSNLCLTPDSWIKSHLGILFFGLWLLLDISSLTLDLYRMRWGPPSLTFSASNRLHRASLWLGLITLPQRASRSQHPRSATPFLCMSFLSLL